VNKLAAFAGALSLAVVAAAQQPAQKPPVAPVHPVTETYFGVKVTDPYRYMENLKDPQVAAWIRAQGEYAGNVLDGIPGRSKLLARVRQLDESEPARISHVTVLPGERYFYLKEGARETANKLYLRDGLDGKEVLLVDPARLDKPGEPPFTISFYAPSFDGQRVVYGLTQGGTETSTIHVLDVGSGQPLSDVIAGVRIPGAAWLPDGSGFFYNRLEKLASGAPASATLERSHVYLHRLGDDPAKDIEVFGAGVAEGLDVPADAIPTVDTAPGSKYAIGVLQRGVDQSIELYEAPLAQVGKPKAKWRRLGDNNVRILDYSLRGDRIYLLVAGRSGPTIAEVSLANPSLAAWGMMLQLAPTSGITGMQAVSDALYVTMLDAGRISLVRIPYKASAEILKLKLPFEGSVHLYSEDPRIAGALVMLSSWTRAPAIYWYDPAKDQISRTPLWPKGPFDEPNDVVASDVTALGDDGTLVPMTILHLKSVQRDGTHPALLIGYGSYSILISPVFNPIWRTWLDRGGVLAFAHVRGGGEYGGFWRFEGLKMGLANRFHDFITCAEYLVKQGYTTPERLAAMGGSAGGILVGRAITEQPDLFRAAVIESGLLDLLHYENTATGVLNVPEFGSTKTLEGFTALESISSYDHVRKDVKYPAVLLEVGMNDPRVPPWQSAKMAARLQADSTSGWPVLLRVTHEAGHSLAATAEARRVLYADEMSFLLWQLGDPDFQPTSPPTNATR
jgi:prolyl oligopeptidase